MPPDATIESCTYAIPGCPPNWANERMHWAAEAREKDRWKRLSHFQAQSARNRRHWSLPGREDSQRLVEITLFRVRLLDDDGAVTSIKPVLDGLKAALVYDDAPRYCKLLVSQYRVDHKIEQKTGVVVSRDIPAGKSITR